MIINSPTVLNSHLRAQDINNWLLICCFRVRLLVESSIRVFNKKVNNSELMLLELLMRKREKKLIYCQIHIKIH